MDNGGYIDKSKEYPQEGSKIRLYEQYKAGTMINISCNSDMIK